jgi:hypothetical protein
VKVIVKFIEGKGIAHKSSGRSWPGRKEALVFVLKGFYKQKEQRGRRDSGWSLQDGLG